MTATSMGAEHVTNDRLAPDAFDLPAALAAREQTKANGQVAGAHRDQGATAAPTEELPQEFVPWSGR